jgi:hypothetical protein
VTEGEGPTWAAKIGPHLLTKFLKLSVVIGTLKAGFSRMAFLLGGWLVGEESDIDLVDMIELTSIPPRRSMGAFRRSLPAYMLSIIQRKPILA